MSRFSKVLFVIMILTLPQNLYANCLDQYKAQFDFLMESLESKDYFEDIAFAEKLPKAGAAGGAVIALVQIAKISVSPFELALAILTGATAGYVGGLGLESIYENANIENDVQQEAKYYRTLKSSIGYIENILDGGTDKYWDKIMPAINHQISRKITPEIFIEKLDTLNTSKGFCWEDKISNIHGIQSAVIRALQLDYTTERLLERK